MLIKRFLNLEIPDNKSCFLWGARQTGKSMYLKEHFPNSRYIDLLKADIYMIYSQNPERLRHEIEAQNKPVTIIIDEIQKIPALLDEVHHMIEAGKGSRFIMCGSSIRRLKYTGANLLGGRAWRYMFMPLCYTEIKELDWSKIFNRGLLPGNYTAQGSVHKSMASYLYDYILPEVQYEANLRKREAFGRFIDAACFASGEIVNYANIARDCGIDAKTVRTYFEIMEDMYLGYNLYPYKSRSKRQVITERHKFYFFDTGLANYLKKYEYKAMIGEGAGRAFEHYIFLELMAYKNLCDKRENISYWRTKEGYEVDFITQDNAFEVKMSSNIGKEHVKGLIEFSKEHNLRLHVICLEHKKRVVTIEDKQITIWPIQEFLEELWSNNIWV